MMNLFIAVHVISKRGLDTTTKHNWVSEPHRSGVSEKSDHAEFARLRVAELSGRHEHSPIPSPLTPPLENATTKNVC